MEGVVSKFINDNFKKTWAMLFLMQLIPGVSVSSETFLDEKIVLINGDIIFVVTPGSPALGKAHRINNDGTTTLLWRMDGWWSIGDHKVVELSEDAIFVMSSGSTPKGKAYRLNDRGVMALIWEVSGWWSHNIRFVDNGRYLMRIELSHSSYPDSINDIGIVFYDNGLEIKRYSPIELMNRSEMHLNSEGSVTWASVDGMPSPKFIVLSVGECIEYMFNYRTGNVAYKQDKCNKTFFAPKSESDFDILPVNLPLYGFD